MLRKLAEKVRNIVKIAQITLSTGDSGLDSTGQVQYLGKTTNTALICPYGVSSNAPVNSNVLLLSVGGSAQNMVGIAYNTENRFRDLKEGESAFGNFVSKNHIYFDNDGNVTIKAGNDGGKFRYENDNGFIEMDEDGTCIVNDNFKVIK